MIVAITNVIVGGRQYLTGEVIEDVPAELVDGLLERELVVIGVDEVPEGEDMIDLIDLADEPVKQVAPVKSTLKVTPPREKKAPPKKKTAEVPVMVPGGIDPELM